MKKLTLTILAAVCLAGLAMAAVRLTCMKFHEENVIGLLSQEEVMEDIEDPGLKADAMNSHRFIVESTEGMSMAQARKWCLELAKYRCSIYEDRDWESMNMMLVYYYTLLTNEINVIRGIEKDMYYAEGQVTIFGLDAYPYLTRRGLKKKAFIVYDEGNGKKRYVFPRRITRQARILAGQTSSY